MLVSAFFALPLGVFDQCGLKMKHKPPKNNKTIAEMTEELRDKYRKILEEPIPDRLKALIDELKSKDKRGRK